MANGSRESEWAARAQSFGAVARQYDRARPSYPHALVDDVVALVPGPEVVEVGAGTGKATELFAVRGLRLTCVEPDPQMAGVLEGKRLPVEVVVSSFEDWQPAKRFDAMIAAQSWHWTDPKTRYDKAARALRQGGVLALFWNHVSWQETPLRAAIDAVYRSHGIRVNDGNPARTNPSGTTETALRDDLARLPTFSDVEMRTYSAPTEYTAAEWCDYLASTSDHLLLDPATRDAVLADIAAVIDAHGGAIEVPRECDLYLARRTAARG